MGCNASTNVGSNPRISKESSRSAITPPQYIYPHPHSSRRQKVIVCKASDRVKLSAALDYDHDDSSHCTASESSSSLICVVRSDKLAFKGAGIRRHSHRKRQRHNGNDNERIVVLHQSPMSSPAQTTRKKALPVLEELLTKTQRKDKDGRKITMPPSGRTGDRKLTMPPKGGPKEDRKPTTTRITPSGKLLMSPHLCQMSDGCLEKLNDRPKPVQRILSSKEFNGHFEDSSSRGFADFERSCGFATKVAGA